MIRTGLTAIFIFISTLCSALQLDTLYINNGIVKDKQQPVPFTYFNTTPSFDSVDAFIQLHLGDTLSLYIVNTDTIAHELVLESIMTPIIVPERGTSSVTFIGRDEGAYRLFSATQAGRMLGLSSLILVTKPGEPHFIWQLRDAEGSINRSITQTFTFNPTTYQPDYFSINALRFPNTSTDTMGYVTGRVGDSIYINIVNAGFMDHSIHFHGYHVVLEASNQKNTQLNWNKDTFPIKPGAWIRIRLVPHQPGKFPVHDHNLVAVTSGGNYPGGMIGILDITP